MIGLLGIGIGARCSASRCARGSGGRALLVLMWTAVLPPENNPFMDDHLIYAMVLVLITALGAGHTFGLGRSGKSRRCAVTPGSAEPPPPGLGGGSSTRGGLRGEARQESKSPSRAALGSPARFGVWTVRSGKVSGKGPAESRGAVRLGSNVLAGPAEDPMRRDGPVGTKGPGRR